MKGIAGLQAAAAGRRRAVLAVIARREWLLQMLALGVAGCRGRRDAAAARATTVTIAVPGLGVFDPDERDGHALIFLPLVTPGPRGDLEGRLADRWEHSSDYAEWTYHLRRDIRWQDGVPVTAHDVKFTLDLASHSNVGEGHFPSNAVLDDFTVRIRESRGYEHDFPIWPKHRLERLDPKTFWDWEFWTRPEGNGAYRFVRDLPQQMIEFEANPDYYLGKPAVARVVFKFVGQGGMLTELLSGNADIVLQGDPFEIPAVLADRRFLVYYSLAPSAAAIFWKCDHPILRDPRIRRALTLAVDRRELLGAANLPADLPVSDGVFTRRQLRRRELPAPLPYDPAQAQALLEAAGWRAGNRDGVRERDGRPFRFTAITNPDSGLPRLAVLVQAHLRRVGVHMEVQLGPGTSPMSGGNFEAALSFNPDNADFQRTYFGRGNIRTGYSNPAAHRAIDAAFAAADPDEQDRRYRELTDIYRADPPVTRLIPRTRVHFVHRRVHGLTTPFHADPDRFMEDLWLDDRPELQ